MCHPAWGSVWWNPRKANVDLSTPLNSCSKLIPSRCIIINCVLFTDSQHKFVALNLHHCHLGRHHRGAQVVSNFNQDKLFSSLIKRKTEVGITNIEMNLSSCCHFYRNTFWSHWIMVPAYTPLEGIYSFQKSMPLQSGTTGKYKFFSRKKNKECKKPSNKVTNEMHRCHSPTTFPSPLPP